MPSSSGRAGAAAVMKGKKKPLAKARPRVPPPAEIPHRPIITLNAVDLAVQPEGSTRSRVPYRPLSPSPIVLSPAALTSPPPPPPLRIRDLSSEASTSTSSDIRLVPNKDESPAFVRAKLAFYDLLRKGTYLSRTPDWLLSTATAAVPGHQPKWAFRRPHLAEPAPEDAAALEQRRETIKQAERQRLEQHDDAVQGLCCRLVCFGSFR